MIGWQLGYALARRLEAQDKWSAAAAVYEGLLRRGGQVNPKIVFRRGHALFRLDRLDEALPLLATAVRLRPEEAAWQYRLGFVLERRKQFAQALVAYRAAIALVTEPPAGWQRRARACEAAIAHARLERAIKERAATWQLVEVLEDGLAARDSDPRWTEKLGDARFKMGRYEAAAEAYGHAAALEPETAALHFKHGWALEMEGRAAEADLAYAEAIRLDVGGESAEAGIGSFFQAKGQWRLAAEHYARSVQEAPASAELWYRLGQALQKTYDWAGAAEALREGHIHAPTDLRFNYRLGLSYERLGKPEQAEAAYGPVLASPAPAHRYWKYRLGCVLHQQGKHREACVAFHLSRPDEPGRGTASVTSAGPEDAYSETALAEDLLQARAAQSADACYDVGLRADDAGFLPLAAAAYAEAVTRTQEHSPWRYARLGRALMLTGRYREACTAFLEMRQFKRPHGVDAVGYLRHKRHRQGMPYTEYMETLDIQAGTILYESSHGAAAAGNPLHLFRAIVKDSRFDGFRHIWVLNEPAQVPADLAGRPDVVLVARDSDLYLRYLATAEYLINDNTFPPYFIRRDGQQYLNTWHGTPLKTLGRDIKGGVMEHRNAARNFLHATHIIAPNQFTADCLIDKYDVAGLFNGRLAVTGYPRIDGTLTAGAEARGNLRDRLGVPEGRKIVLYAPTWRGSLSRRNLDSDRLRADVARLAAGDWHLLYRGHAMTGGGTDSDLDRHVVPADVDTNDLLAVVDVLITDYSSIFFDFIPTGRPIIYYAYDLDEYREERGLYFDLDTMPGRACRDIESAVALTTAAVSRGGTAGGYRDARARFCPLEDGAAARRTIGFFFFGETEHEVPNRQDGRRNILVFQGSFLPNGITSSYLNLVSNLDPTENNVYVAVDPEAVASQPDRLEKFAQNPDYVRVLGRVGYHVLTPEERWVVDKFNAQHTVDRSEMWEVVRRAFGREFRRMFGTAGFDSIICFEGYARFWAALLGSAPAPSARKAIYLHNDMYREWRTRFEYLEGMFRLYRNFDALISVTESVAEENRRQLSGRFDLDPGMFAFSNNMLDPEGTTALAREPLDADIAEWVDRDDGTLFMTLGRLSPEKGHAKLIRAFADVAAERPGVKLAILGDGPLREGLEKLVEELGLSGKVLLAGRRLNPFPALRRADCFVFSSDYEGQGLVVLEALLLDRPVVSTDVVGPRSVLSEGHGLLVENSQAGLSEGMRRFLDGTVPHEPFDYERYQKDALNAFASLAF